MNLHGLVSQQIGRINPFTKATLRQSTGYEITADGTQTPTYREWDVSIQVQALSTDELQRVDGLNLQGNKQGVYLNGNWNGVVRASRMGGDLLVFGGQTWLVVSVIESWPDWCKLLVLQQVP